MKTYYYPLLIVAACSCNNINPLPRQTPIARDTLIKARGEIVTSTIEQESQDTIQVLKAVAHSRRSTSKAHHLPIQKDTLLPAATTIAPDTINKDSIPDLPAKPASYQRLLKEHNDLA